MDMLRVALCQIDTAVGDISGNGSKIADYLSRAETAGAHLALFPELAISGYPPEDLLLKRHFLNDCALELGRVSKTTADTVAVVGYPELDHESGNTYNALALMAGQRIVGRYRKVLLPNYGVFDERRYFTPGNRGATFNLGPMCVGLSICEDIWQDGSPIEDEVRMGAQVVISINASPYHQGKGDERQQMLSDRARKYGCYVLFCNAVGSQDELVFDGSSLVIDPQGEVLVRGRQFEEDLIVLELPAAEGGGLDKGSSQTGDMLEVDSLADFDMAAPSVEVPARETPAILKPEDEVYKALVVGTHDYSEKNGFEHVVLGISGGVDSALVACVAVDALGPECVTGVVMPSPHSSAETQSDARQLAASLGIQCIDLSIEGAMDVYEKILHDVFSDTEPDITEENIQARIRGNLLMALSNKFGWLVLTTGNKSEYSVGYATLYGDMAGGFAVLKDVPKALVFDLARNRNAAPDSPIPPAVLTRPPTAELRPDQRDEDSLPPYEILDPILEGYVEMDLSADQLVEKGFERETVESVIHMIDLSEYKRRQTPPGVKIRPKSFGRDRRLPITNLYKG